MKALLIAYALGCILALVCGVSLGSGLTAKAPCLPGMTQVALDGQVWCMPDTKLHQLETGYCGSGGKYPNSGGMLRLDECVSRFRDGDQVSP